MRAGSQGLNSFSFGNKVNMLLNTMSVLAGQSTMTSVCHLVKQEDDLTCFLSRN